MRMKMFSAETVEDAKAAIFAEMGDDAVILSERVVDGGVEVRAAIDKMNASGGANEPLFLRNARDGANGRGHENPIFSRVRDAILWHGAPTRFADRVAGAAVAADAHAIDPEDAIAEGLSAVLECAPLPARLPHDIVLVGAPGHGRTATAAKLTRRAAVARTEVLPVAADLDATAGGAQLAAYLELEKDQIRIAETPDGLFTQLKAIRAEQKRCVIDLPAIVPFDAGDMSSLKDLVAAVRAEPVLVISAEGHPEDQLEACKAFARSGVKRAIITKLDVVRRRGGIVAALASSGIAFSHLAVSPFIGGGLVPAAPSRLASLLMEDAAADVIAMRGAA